jgi:C1A family cysteine protease
MNFKYAAIPDKPDARDHLAAPPSPGAVIAAQVDLREWFPPIRNQGQEGACTMFAGTAILSWLYKRFKNQEYVFSPQFGYRAERIIEGSLDVDDGAQSRTMMAIMKDTGICLETSDPYVDTGWRTPTTHKQLSEAHLYRIGAYHRIVDLETLKSVLASGYVASLAIRVFESFESDAVAQTGMVPLPQPTEKNLGGHEVVACGYSDTSKTLIVRNSWDVTWGDQGYFYLPYGYWPFVSDSWIAHMGPAWK